MASGNLQPYNYEPLEVPGSYDSDTTESETWESEENEEHTENADRIGNTLWCKCGHCEAMPTGRESICCHEIDQVNQKMEDDGVECMTLHEGFEGVCLNRHVIEMSLYAYVQEVLPIDDNEPPNKTYRYIAYRNFTRFIYHRLRKYERKVIPSCCVNRIRQGFPSQEYCGFKYARP